MKLKTIIVLILLNICNTCLTHKSEEYVKDKVTSDIPLYDIGHAMLPDTSKYRIVNDIIPMSLFSTALMTSKNQELLVKALVVTFIIRMLTVYATVLPKSTKGECKFKKSYIGGCHDKLFSGHMSMIVISSIALISSFPQYRNYIILLNIVAGIMIVSSRDHYTVDVLLAVFLSSYIAKYYKL